MLVSSMLMEIILTHLMFLTSDIRMLLTRIRDIHRLLRIRDIRRFLPRIRRFQVELSGLPNSMDRTHRLQGADEATEGRGVNRALVRA